MLNRPISGVCGLKGDQLQGTPLLFRSYRSMVNIYTELGYWVKLYACIVHVNTGEIRGICKGLCL